MLLKVKSPVFIDRLIFEVDHSEPCTLQAVLKDDTGFVCSEMETKIANNQRTLNWNGLNDLPYGVYYLEVKNGVDESRMRLVKRV
jgi:hypothetical protein